MNKQIFEEYLQSLEIISAEMLYEESHYVFTTIESLPDEYQEKVMKCINIAVEAGMRRL